MGLTKPKLINNVKIKLFELGYTEFKDSNFALFIKYTGDGMFLSLALTVSSLFYDQFSAEYYYCTHTSVNRFGGDIPKECGSAIHWLLSSDELRSVTPQGGMKGVWSGLKPEEIELFIETVKLTEPRMLNRKIFLIDRITQSRTIEQIVNRHNAVKEEVQHPGIKSSEKYLIATQRYAPLDWYHAAERVLCESGETLTLQLIRLLAERAYREFVLLGS